MKKLLTFVAVFACGIAVGTVFNTRIPPSRQSAVTVTYPVGTVQHPGTDSPDVVFRTVRLVPARNGTLDRPAWTFDLDHSRKYVEEEKKADD